MVGIVLVTLDLLVATWTFWLFAWIWVAYLWVEIVYFILLFRDTTWFGFVWCRVGCGGTLLV